MRKKTEKSRYLNLLLIIIIVLILTLFIQYIDENRKTSYISNEIRLNQMDYSDLVTEKDYLNYLIENGNKSSCNEIETSYEYSIKKMYKLSNKLEKYLKEPDFVWDEYQYLRRTLINYQIEYWLLAKKINKMCDPDYETVLYFFSQEKTCHDCNAQAIILNHVRLESENHVLTFALDATFNGTISLLVKKYGVTNDRVTIVIDDKPYHFQDIDSLKKILCSANNKLNFCPKIINQTIQT